MLNPVQILVKSEDRTEMIKNQRLLKFDPEISEE